MFCAVVFKENFFFPLQFKEVENLRAQNDELVQLKQKYEDQQRALQQAHTYKQQCEKDILGYQAELTELR